jgi:predicted metal-dependent enzyme (double-stranded beta helix superfamily)
MVPGLAFGPGDLDACGRRHQPAHNGGMCDFGRGPHRHDHLHGPDDPARDHFGFLVDVPEVRALIAETRRLTTEIADTAQRVEALKPAFSRLLAADGWLPEPYGSPDTRSGMGGGIGQYALYRAEDLCLFSLVIPSGAETPVHDHLAWGLIGVYRGRQDETVYRRLDDGRNEARARLEVSKRQTMDTGQFYALLPPRDDIHFVKTVSDGPSISIHLLANDTACVWRHRFDPEAGTVEPFRSGYSNAPCPDEPPTLPTGSTP